MTKFRVSGLALALVAALLVGCSNGDDGKTDGASHDMHDSMTHGDMNHGAGSAALPAGANRLCPVTGEEVSSEVFTEYKGKKVYFCCDDCVAKFKASPDEYFAKAYPDAGK